MIILCIKFVGIKWDTLCTLHNAVKAVFFRIMGIVIYGKIIKKTQYEVKKQHWQACFLKRKRKKYVVKIHQYQVLNSGSNNNF
jgi:hypothetical protein